MPPPDAARNVRVDVKGVDPGALLAVEKDPDGGTAASLNSAATGGFRLPLVLGQSAAGDLTLPDPEPGAGAIFDRATAPPPIIYRIAQQDLFGRWSPWASIVSPTPERPLPPRPVLLATYSQPADPEVAGGDIRIAVNVPPLASLAPGAHPLAALDVTLDDLSDGSETSAAPAIADPLAPPRELVSTLAGPILDVTEQRKLRITAVWRDIEGRLSEPSEPQVLTLTDPRPPQQLPPPPDALLYASRADVTGLSHVETSWGVTAGQEHFAVYYSDENRLRAHLSRDDADTVDGDLLNALDAAADAPSRATLYRSHEDRFPAHLFERLEGVLFEAEGGRMAFRHGLSGSLKILSFYRIAAESVANARPDIGALPLHVYAVPSADRPPKPVIEVRPAGSADGLAATIRIRAGEGGPLAANWRLRRSNLGATDVRRMPIVRSGPISETVEGTPVVAEVTDDGPLDIAPAALLLPFVRYTWIAEIQGETAPGSAAAGRPVAGLWSEASDPVSLVLIGDGPPEAAENLDAQGTLGTDGISGVALSFETAVPLAAGEAGSFRARAFRQQPDGPLETLPETEISGLGPFKISGVPINAAAAGVPPGTRYRLVIVDPLGRESPPAETEIS